MKTFKVLFFLYKECLEKGSNQLFMTLYTLFMYLSLCSVHKQLIRTLFEAHIVGNGLNLFRLGFN